MPRLRQRLCIGLEFLRVSALLYEARSRPMIDLALFRRIRPAMPFYRL